MLNLKIKKNIIFNFNNNLDLVSVFFQSHMQHISEISIILKQKKVEEQTIKKSSQMLEVSSQNLQKQEK